MTDSQPALRTHRLDPITEHGARNSVPRREAGRWRLLFAGGSLLFGLLGLAACSDDPQLKSGIHTGGSGGGEAGAGGTAGSSGGSGGKGGAGGGGGIGGGGGGGSAGSGGGGGSIEVGDHLRFWGASHGVPGPVRSVSSDRGGNVWAANEASLLLLRPGTEVWESFDEADGLRPYPRISVAGGEAGEVWVGYRGLFGEEDPFEDPPELRNSGGVDHVRLDGDRLTSFHYEIFSPPSATYPTGRYILRTCYRVVPVLSGPYAGDVWFACNHGVAMWNERFQTVQEHQHPATNNEDGSLLAGDFRGLAVTPSGNVWLGGDERTALLHYADEGGQFWAEMNPVVDVFPPGIALVPGDQDWVMDLINDGAGGIWVASFGNGLAHMAADGTWSYLNSGQGLPDDRVVALALDPDGSLWIATDSGVLRLRDGRFVQEINGLDGLAGSVLNLRVDSDSSPRRVLIGTSAGVGIYDGP